MELRKRKLPRQLKDSKLSNDPALHYRFWTHEQVLQWLRGLNKGFYAQYQEEFESSRLDGRTFEALSNVKYLKEAFGMATEDALSLAAVALSRVKHHKRLVPNTASSSLKSDYEERLLFQTSSSETDNSFNPLIAPSSNTEFSREAIKIANTNWKQLRCKTFILKYSPRCILSIYAIIGVVFLSIGFSTLFLSQSVTYQEFPAYHNLIECSLGDQDWGKECTVEYILDHDFEPPIYFHYKLSKFYQNHRSYVRSQSMQQIQNKGDLLDPKSYKYCSPDQVTKSQINDLVMLPCGLIANSFFNDKYKVSYTEPGSSTEIEFCDDPDHCNQNEQNDDGDGRDGSSSWTDTSWFASPNWEKKGIAWESDANYRFGYTQQIEGKTTNINSLQKMQGVTLPDIHDEDLMVWMRTSVSSTFTKLHRIIRGQRLKKGGTLRVTIRNYFAVDIFDGTKSIVITTVGTLGGYNNVLPILYIIMGLLSILVVVVFKVMIRRNRIGPHCRSSGRSGEYQKDLDMIEMNKSIEEREVIKKSNQSRNSSKIVFNV